MGGMLTEQRGVHFIPVRHAEYLRHGDQVLHKSFSPASHHELMTPVDKPLPAGNSSRVFIQICTKGQLAKQRPGRARNLLRLG